MGALTFYITNKNIITNTTQSQLIAQINLLFSNPTLSIDPATNNISIVTNYNIFTGKGIPLKILGIAGDRFLNTIDGTVYQKSSSEWANIGKISYAAFITDSYFILPNIVGNLTAQSNPTPTPTPDPTPLPNPNPTPTPTPDPTPIADLGSVLFTINTDPIIPDTSNAILYFNDDGLFLKTADNKTFVVNLTNVTPVVEPPTPTSAPYITNYNDIDKDTDMPIYLNDQTNPSQSFPLTAGTNTNANITALSAYNQISPLPTGPFLTEVFNFSDEFMYLGFSNGALLNLDETSSYVLTPLEKKMFEVPPGFTNITVTLGGSTATGEMRVTVAALAA